MYFKNTIGSIPVYRRFVFSLFSNKNDVDVLIECGFLKKDIVRLCEFWRVLKNTYWLKSIYLVYIRNKEVSNNEKTSIFEWKEKYSATSYENVRQERPFTLRSMKDPDKLKQRGCTDHEMNVNRKNCFRKTLSTRILHRICGSTFIILVFSDE